MGGGGCEYGDAGEILGEGRSKLECAPKFLWVPVQFCTWVLALPVESQHTLCSKGCIMVHDVTEEQRHAIEAGKIPEPLLTLFGRVVELYFEIMEEERMALTSTLQTDSKPVVGGSSA